jgi:hypothetical protein
MSHFDLRRLSLGAIGSVGAALFLFLFVLTYHTPEWVEDFAAAYIEREASRQIDERIDSFQPPAGEGALSRLASALYDANEAEIERQKEALRLQVHERMADAIAEIRNLDCECRDKWAQWIEEGSVARMKALNLSNDAIQEFIHATYAQVVDNLKHDIRIFTGANSSMFLLLLAIAFLKPQAVLQVLVPGLLLAAATLICSYFYVFEQNWLLTIIHNDYLGFVYLAYLGLVFGLLCDIVLNRARITTRIVNAVLNAVGSAASAVPC